MNELLTTIKPWSSTRTENVGPSTGFPRRKEIPGSSFLANPFKTIKSKHPWCQKNHTSRPKLIAGAGAAIAFPTITPPRVLGKDAPSNCINRGFVGMGNYGRGIMTAVINHNAA